MIFTRLNLYCPICRTSFDWHKGYGQMVRCCCRECHEEWEWRRALSLMGKEYRPRGERQGLLLEDVP